MTLFLDFRAITWAAALSWSYLELKTCSKLLNRVVSLLWNTSRACDVPTASAHWMLCAMVVALSGGLFFFFPMLHFVFIVFFLGLGQVSWWVDEAESSGPGRKQWIYYVEWHPGVCGPSEPGGARGAREWVISLPPLPPPPERHQSRWRGLAINLALGGASRWEIEKYLES